MTYHIVLFHGSSGIVVAPINPVPLTNAEAENLGTIGIPPLRVRNDKEAEFPQALEAVL